MVPGSRLGFEWAVNDGPVQQIGPREPRILRLARLAAGNHEITIRSALPAGLVGDAASLTLHIAPPFWRRAWFLATLVLAAVTAAAAAHRVRLVRLQELHRVRSRIVADGVGARLAWQVDNLEGLAMSSKQRRHLLLILKEAIHNARRHVRPRTIEVAVERTDGQLAIAVTDDGCGFVPAAQGDAGQGLGAGRMGMRSLFARWRSRR